MFYNLRSGKTIEISVEEFLRMSDEDFQDLDTLDVGDHQEDPFCNSALLGDQSLFDEDSTIPLVSIPRHTKLLEREFFEQE